MGNQLSPPKLLLHCFAEPKGNQWQAFCLDFDLAAQGDSLSEVREKLHEMICSYVYDAIAGEDREFADSLLRRRAPAKLWMRYWMRYYSYRYMFLRRILGVIGMNARKLQLISQPVPLVPAHRC